MINVMGLYKENMARWTCKVIDIEYMGYLIASYLDFSVFSVSQVTKLRKELNELKKKTESCSVDTALMALQALVGRSPALFDSYAAIAALEEVVDLAQKYAGERYSRNQIILRKCRPLVADASLQNILIKLVASKEEAEIAKAIEKAIESSQAEKCFSPPVTAGRTRGPSYGYRRGRGSRRCWNCGHLGHLQRACPRAEASKR